MNNRYFSMREALFIGWRKSWDQAQFLFGLFLIWIAYMVLLILLTDITKNMAPLNLIPIIIRFIVGPVMGVGVSRIYYDIYTTGKSNYRELYQSVRYVVRCLFATLEVAAFFIGWVLVSGLGIFGLMYILPRFIIISQSTFPLIGVIIITIPSLFCLAIALNIGAMFIFANIAIISDDAPTVSKALKMSRVITKGHRVKLLLFGLLTSFLVSITFGFLLSVVAIAWVDVYKKLSKN